jgi:hypothetical protein
LSNVSIDTVGLWFVPSGAITVTTTKDQPNNPWATVTIINNRIVVTARSWVWSLSPIVHINGKTIQINGMRG